jgi:uncharacterized protein (DUF2062 family)
MVEVGANVTWGDWWISLFTPIVEVGSPLIAGSLVVATVAGLATYPVTLRVMERVRRRHEERKLARQARRHRKQEMKTVAAASVSARQN